MSALLTLMAVMLQTFLTLAMMSLNSVYRSLNLPTPSFGTKPLSIAVINTIAFGTAIAVGLLLNRVPLRRAFPFRRPTFFQLLTMGLIVLGADVLVSELDNLMRSIAAPPDWITDQYKELFPPYAGVWSRSFLLVVIAPLTEELFFRGVVLRGLLSRYPPWASVLLAALLFAVGHTNPWQFASAFCIGVAFGWFYVRTRSLALCILGHAFSNGLFVLFTSQLFYVRGLTSGADLTLVEFQPWWANLAGMVALGVGVLAFLQATPLREAAPPAPPPLPPLPASSNSDAPVGSV